MSNFIWITTSFEGFHRWLNAPYEEAFLRNIHRHLFQVKIYIEVFNNERDIEFFKFKKYINEFDGFKKYVDGSCEFFSDRLYEYIENKYPNRNAVIEISEDGENGSRKEY